MRHENVACQNFHTELSTGKRSHREYVRPGRRGRPSELPYRASAMKEKADKMSGTLRVSLITPARVRRMAVSRSMSTFLLSLAEAWMNQAGQVH